MSEVIIRVERPDWYEEWPLDMVERVFLLKGYKYGVELKDYYGKTDLEGTINGDMLEVVYRESPEIVEPACMERHERLKAFHDWLQSP